MPSIASAVQWAINIANDDTHGYDQTSRYGPDYDCSSFVCTALNQAGFDIQPYNTTSTMLQALIRIGFQTCSAPFRAGDIHLAVGHHTAMQINGTQLVQASENEHGTATGGQTGDQTGTEIWVTNYYNYPWDYHLRYNRQLSPDHDFVYHVGPTYSYTMSQEEIDNNILAVYERMTGYGWTIDAIAGMCGCLMAESTMNPGVFEGDSTAQITNYPYYGGGVGLAQWTDYPPYQEQYPNPLLWHAQQEGQLWFDGNFQCYLFTKADDTSYTSMGYGQGPRWGWQQSQSYPSESFTDFINSEEGTWSNACLYWLFCFELHSFDPATVGSLITPRINNARYAYELISEYAPAPVKKKKGMPIWMMVRYRI